MLARDNDVIEHGEVDCLTSQCQPTGDTAIKLAWRGIAARVIMSQNYPRAAVNRRIRDDLSQRKMRTAVVAVMPGKVDAARLVVDMGNPDMFLVRIRLGQAIGEEPPGRFETIETQR